MKAGDHIRITRGGASEHAIEVGDRTVLHFVKGQGVKRSRLAELARGARVEVVTHRHPVYAPRHVVARAFSRLAESAYGAMFQGSEDFASWCKTGRPQARSLVPIAARASPERAAQPAPTAPAAASQVARGRPGPARTAPRPAVALARKPRKKTPGSARAPGKAARGVKSSAPAGPPKPARAGKKAVSPGAPRKKARAAPPARKPPTPAKQRRRLAPSATARSRKRVAAPPSKPKRGKAPGRRAAAGR